MIEASQTPFHLFAFIFYRKYLVGINNQPDVKIGSFSGRGLKKALNKWYNQYKDKDLLRLLTMYKHSYSWSDKDLFKLYHVKPLNEGLLKKNYAQKLLNILNKAFFSRNRFRN